jgi:hypothetical protein
MGHYCDYYDFYSERDQILKMRREKKHKVSCAIGHSKRKKKR